MPEIDYVRVRTDDGEVSLVRSTLPLYPGVKVLDKPATYDNGDPLPFKPKTAVTAQTEKEAPSPEPARKSGQKATTDTRGEV